MEAVIFIGIQGSGKSTFYRQRFFDTHVRLSLDMLKTRYRQRMLIEACVAARQRFVVDNTNVLAEERAEYIRLRMPADFRYMAIFSSRRWSVRLRGINNAAARLSFR
jgi:predicted kinase